jgi:hypothetical protein
LLAAGGPADEASGVVAVAGGLGVHVLGRGDPHLLDREVLLVQDAERRDGLVRSDSGDDQLAGVRAAVEAAEGQRQVAELRDRYLAATAVGISHPLPNGGGDRAGRRVELAVSGCRQGVGRGQAPVA